MIINIIISIFFRKIILLLNTTTIIKMEIDTINTPTPLDTQDELKNALFKSIEQSMSCNKLTAILSSLDPETVMTLPTMTSTRGDPFSKRSLKDHAGCTLIHSCLN